MTADAMQSIEWFRRAQLAEAGDIVARCAQLCERVLEAAGDKADPAIVQLQHDCASWNMKWTDCQVDGPVEAEADYERAMA